MTTSPFVNKIRLLMVRSGDRHLEIKKKIIAHV